MPKHDKLKSNDIEQYLKDQSSELFQEAMIFPVGCDFLGKFSGPDRDLLLRHMATSGYWFLTRDSFHSYFSRRTSNIYAYRLLSLKPLSYKNVNEALFLRKHGPFEKGYIPTAKSYIAIAPDGAVKYGRNWHNVHQEFVAPGDSVTVDTSEKTFLAIHSQSAVLEVNESSPNGKCIVPLLLNNLEDEFKAVLESPVVRQYGFDSSLVPAGSIKDGDSDIVVTGGWRGYSVYAYVNPGEEGYVYLKIFEATKDISLSSYAEEPQRTMCYIGWSDNVRQQFLYRVSVLIGEGDPGTDYPARFELWFVPNSGKPERKLIEKIYLVEGWSR